jgi:nitroreductase
LDAFEAMETARSIRRFRPDPIDPASIERLIWAATRASNPHNVQCWDFVVVQDPLVRAHVGELFRRAADERRAGAGANAPRSGEPSDSGPRTNAALDLMAGIADVPAIVFVCGADVYPPDAPDPVYMYSALYGAAQNLLVAARAMGLGAAFTAFHRADEPGLRSLLGIPDDRTIGATIPLGWPDQPFGPVRRKPVAEVLHHDHW